MQTGSTTAAVLEELRRGAHTTSALMQSSGLSRNGVSMALRRLNRAGCEIVNVRRKAGNHEALYLLVHDPDSSGPRICRTPGCGTHLSASNRTPYCRLHLTDVALMVYMEMICEWLDEQMGEEVEDEQLALCLA